jgi:hypothetical protein
LVCNKMSVKVVGRSYRNTKRNVANNDIAAKITTTKRIQYLPNVPGPVATDPLFNYNTLLLHGDGLTGANNTVFSDSSSIGLIPFPGTFSNYFNGTTDYLTSGTNTGFLTGNFTVEAWIYLTKNQTSTVFCNRFRLEITSSTTISVINNGIANLITSAVVPNLLNRWAHIAVSRSSTTLILFVDGIQITSITNSTNFDVNTTRIGIEAGSLINPFAGYISNLRVLNGTALYTANFTPPTTPLTAITNTQILTCQSSTFKDNSTNNFTLTPSGTPAISAGGNGIAIGGKPQQGTFSPFSQTGWSNLFNGTTDYLQFPRSAGLITTGPFTAEAWVNIAGHKNANQIISCQYWSIGQNGGWCVNGNASGNIEFAASDQVFNTFPIRMTSSTVLAVNTWYHVAVVRDSNNYLNMYINGVLVATPVYFPFDLSRNTGGTQTYWLTNIGINNADGTNYNYINGYVSNARIVKGIAVYTSNFTPPTTPLSVIGTPDNTTLLTCRDNTLTDSSQNVLTNTLTRGGTPSVQVYSPMVAKSSYSSSSVGGSVYFTNSATDYLEILNFPFPLGSSDFTIEFWAYPTTAPATSWTPFFTLGTGVAGSEIRISQNINNTGWGWLYPNNAGSADTYVGLGTLAINSWHHIAMVRSGSNLYLFRNGVLAASGTSISFNLTNNTRMRIGYSQTQYAATDQGFNGYISNVKITRGKAIYTSAFTPPTSPSTNTDAPVLLLNGTNAGIIDQTAKNNITTYGSAAVSTTQSKFGGSSISLGSGNYVVMPLSNSSTNFGTGDFTIECWIYQLSKAASIPTIFSNYNSYTTGSIGLFAGHTSGTATKYQVGYNGGALSLDAGTIVYNTWVHLALVRSSGTISLYVDGTSVGSFSGAGTLNGVGSNFFIGVAGDTPSTTYINGYIDEFRISKYARYTSNFTPPTSAFADQ